MNINIEIINEVTGEAALNVLSRKCPLSLTSLQEELSAMAKSTEEPLRQEACKAAILSLDN